MKFKNWVSITLMIISAFSIFYFVLYSEPIKLNVIGLIITIICTLLLAKYSKICNEDNYRK